MSMPKGKVIARGYATVVEDDGANYRNIAEQMTELGHKMNHASARNYVLRAMRKFALAFAEAKGETLTEDELDVVAKSPSFQSGVAELVQRLSIED